MAENGLHGRILPPEEWETVLAGTPLADGLVLLDPNHSFIAVVEQDGLVVAQCAAMTTVHLEGLWEAEAVRGHAGVGRALLAILVAELHRHAVGEVLSQSLTTDTDALFEQAGGRKVPGTTWVIPLSQEGT